MPGTISQEELQKEFPHINRGLDGIVAFSSTKSSIDGEKGELIYAGYLIDDLAEHATFEEVCFLLWHDRLPNQSELDELNSALQSQRALPDSVINYLKTTSPDSEPMGVLRTAVSMLADDDDDPSERNPEAYYKKAVNITAKIPGIIAAYARARKNKDIVEPLDHGSTAYNFLYMLNGEEPGNKAQKTMDVCLILHAEHGMNASTFTSRTICATESDIYSAVTGAIGALKGPLHGGANQAVMNMLLNFMADDDLADPAEFVKGKLERKEKIMGFGHRVYKVFDPRAKILRKMAKGLAEETGQKQLYEWSETILKTMKDEKDIDPNVDFFSATVYYSMGIQPDLFTTIFTMSRAAGWTGHYMEQAANNRLIRPRAHYVGPEKLDIEPIEER